MYKKTITYPGFDGTEYTEDFYFNLTKAELTKMELTEEGGLAEKIQRIVAANNTPQIIEIFEELILKSYGVKSADNKRFIKNDEVRDAFKETEAYSILYMELSTDADAASKFVNGIMPADMTQAAAEKAANAAAHPANKTK